MPKAGKYDYPLFDLDLCLEKLRRVHEVLREDEIDRGVVAETLGMVKRGGGFANLISSMDKYGLVRTGGGKITITNLGKVALYGEETERNQAEKTAVQKITLFNELYKQYGTKVTEERIRAFLRQKAFVDIVKAQKIAPNINKIYKKVSKHLLSAETPLEPLTPEVEGVGRRDIMPLETKALQIRYKNVFIQIPPDDVEAIEFAEKALAFMKKQIQEETRQKTTKSD